MTVGLLVEKILAFPSLVPLRLLRHFGILFVSSTVFHYLKCTIVDGHGQNPPNAELRNNPQSAN